MHLVHVLNGEGMKSQEFESDLIFGIFEGNFK